ncbi:hypothetical protein QOT17_016846 [Balamuthia mandrillaris]
MEGTKQHKAFETEEPREYQCCLLRSNGIVRLLQPHEVNNQAYPFSFAFHAPTRDKGICKDCYQTLISRQSCASAKFPYTLIYILALLLFVRELQIIGRKQRYTPDNLSNGISYRTKQTKKNMLSAGLPCFPRHRIPMFTSSSLLCLLAVFFMMVPAILGLTNNTLDLYSPNGRCMPRAEVLKYLPQCDGYTDWPYMYFNLDFAAELQAYGQALLESTTTLDHCLFWNMRLYCSAYAPPCFLAVPPANNSSSNGQVVLYNGTNIPVAVPVAQPTCSYICEQRYTNCTPTMIEWGLEEYIDQWFRCERPYDTTDWGVPSQEIFVPTPPLCLWTWTAWRRLPLKWS